MKNTYGSDHFPICDENPKWWNVNKANWEKFQKLRSEELKEGPNTKNLIQFTETLVSTAQRCIPKNKIKTKQNRRWFNDKCKEAIRLRRKALREFEKEPTTENLQKLKFRAKARKTIKEKKQESWKNYISKLSSATKTKSVWDMIKKIAGKFHTHAINYFSRNNNNKITNKKDIADKLAITFSKNSSAKNGNEKFAKFKQKAEKLKLNLKSNNTKSYNLPFTIEELKDAIQTSRNIAIGPDKIHYEFLKHLPKKITWLSPHNI